MNRDTPDAYGRLAYRGLIAWRERLQREAPLLQRVMAGGPSKQIIDLGCGSGEHTRFLKSLGFDATGLDLSAAQVEAARSADPAGHYIQASLTELAGHLEPGQGGAICVGNTLPHLCEEAELRAFFSGLTQCLAPGAPILLQLLNYDRILDRSERTFPLVFRPGEAGGDETVFLRLMTHHGGGRLTFTPANLRFCPDSESPLEVISAQKISLRGWRRVELEVLAEATGLRVREVFGTMTGEAWSATASDLVLVLERP
jgi:SAM-dependent methyltransferase